MLSESEIQSGTGKPQKQRNHQHSRFVNRLAKTKPPAILPSSHKWGNFLLML